ncbi:MAG: S8 family serine peptidase [Verrucomicrobia bacterium]|nr:S8 family serine peptidase [Verrucomicrobiota bacterium]
MKMRNLIAACRAQVCRGGETLRRFVVVFASLSVGVLPVSAAGEYVQIDGHEAHPTRILAKFKDTVVVAASADALAQVGSRVDWQYRLVPGLTLMEEADTPGLASASGMDETAVRTRLLNRINALKATGLFEYVEPDYIVYPLLTPTDQGFVDGTLWGLQNMGQNGGVPGADIAATAAWDLTTGSTNVIVGVIDTGIRYTHYDLTNQMWINPGEIPGNGIDDDGNGYIDDIHGINAIINSGNPMDDNDHGTHVAGTIGAAANDGNRMVGVAWNVRLMALKFLGASGGGSTGDAIKCIDYGVANGARVLNNSWGGGPFMQSLFDAIVRARDAGVLFVAAAGNDAQNNDVAPSYPANYAVENVISVAAMDRFDQLAGFSHYGLTTVDLGAPGVSIFSSASGSDTDYQSFQGTSMAAPHVSGVAALILSLYPAADLEEITGRLLGGTVPVPSLSGRTVTGGRVNAYNSLTLSGSGVLQLSVTPPSGSVLLSGSDQPIIVKVSDLFGVNTATVTGQVIGVTNLVFANDGQPPDAIANDHLYSAMFQVPSPTGAVTMTLTANAPDKFGVTNEVYYTILPPPPNDHFTNATKVPAAGTTYLANNRFATLEAGEPRHAGLFSAVGSLWWSWSPANNTNVFIDTTGSTIDTVLAIYTGNSVANLQLVAATNDIGIRRQAYLSLPVVAGATYRIAVASANTNSLGSIQLRVAPGGSRDVTPPTVFVANPLSGLAVSNQVISVQGTSVDPAPNATGVSEVFLSVNGGIAVTAIGTTNWSVPALLQSGQNVLQVTSVDAAGNFSPRVTVQVYYLPNDPPNDVLANAIPLTAMPERAEGYNTNATKQIGEPHHAGNAGGRSMWYFYQPPGDGVLVLNTTNSTFDTLLAMYTGSVVTNLTLIASNDDATDGEPGGISQIVQAVRSNTVYYIAVDGYDGVSGFVSLNYSFTPATLFHLAVGSATGGAVLPASGYYASNSTVTLTATPAAYYRFSSWSGDLVSSVNPVTVVVQSNMTVTPVFAPVEFTDGFESGNFSQLGWTTSGTKPWFVSDAVTSVGQWAARSGQMNDNQVSQQMSSLILTTNLFAGNVTFDYRVSSEPIYDYLKFSVDGVEVQRWSGEVGWATFMFPVTAGDHTLRWDYVKDPTLSAGLDAAFLDNVVLPFSLPIDETTPAVLQIIRLPDGSLLLEIHGQTDREYLIQATTDFSVWQTIATRVAAGGVIQFTDPNTGAHPVRFYRAIVPVP